MKIYKVSARIVCNCEICKLKNDFEFYDEFKANNAELAIKLANAKFIMIQDDIIEEFQEHYYELEIINCSEN